MVINQSLKTNHLLLEWHHEIKQLEKKNQTLKLIIDYLEQEIAQKEQGLNEQMMRTGKVIEDARAMSLIERHVTLAQKAIYSDPVANQTAAGGSSMESFSLLGYLLTSLAKVLNQFSGILAEGAKIKKMTLVPLFSLFLSSPFSADLDNLLEQQSIAEDIPELGSSRAAVIAHITRRLLLKELSIQEAPQDLSVMNSLPVNEIERGPLASSRVDFQNGQKIKREFLISGNLGAGSYEGENLKFASLPADLFWKDNRSGAAGAHVVNFTKEGQAVATASNSSSNDAQVTKVGPPAEEQAAPQLAPKTYIVQKGDTLWQISKRFGLSLKALIQANPEVASNPNLLKIGQTITIPSGQPTSRGIASTAQSVQQTNLSNKKSWYTIQSGDTLNKIAAQYGTTVEDIVAFNSNLPNANTILSVGQQLAIPSGAVVSSNTSPPTAPVNPSQLAVGHFIWPAHGVITQQPSASHMALDIGLPLGTPIVAADGGQVVTAGWSNYGYGYYIVIDHGHRFDHPKRLLTLYAHLSSLNVQVGKSVSQGTVIGYSGSTGKSTGPHLHFEVRLDNVRKNPWNYLNSRS